MYHEICHLRIAISIRYDISCTTPGLTIWSCYITASVPIPVPVPIGTEQKVPVPVPPGKKWFRPIPNIFNNNISLYCYSLYVVYVHVPFVLLFFALFYRQFNKHGPDRIFVEFLVNLSSDSICVQVV